MTQLYEIKVKLSDNQKKESDRRISQKGNHRPETDERLCPETIFCMFHQLLQKDWKRTAN